MVDPLTKRSQSPTTSRASEVDRANPTVAKTEAAAPQPPEVPVPSAKGSVPPPIDPGAVAKNDVEVRKALQTLTGEVAALRSGDSEGLAKALSKARAAPRQDVRDALNALIGGLGEHADYVSLVLTHVKTDHFDHAKADLKSVAREMGRILPTENVSSQMVKDVQARVKTGFADALQELKKADVAADLPKIAAMPTDEALDTLMSFGATDRGEAEDWLNAARANPKDISLLAEVRSSLTDRIGVVESVAKEADVEMAQDASSDPSRSLAKLLLRYPALAPSVLEELGLPEQSVFPPSGGSSSPFLRKVELVMEDASNRWLQVGIGVGVTLAGFIPAGIGAAVVGSHGVVQVLHAVDAARTARVTAACGFIPRAAAERLDDEVVGVIVATSLATLMSLAGAAGGANAAAEVAKLGAKDALARVAALVQANPVWVAAGVGTLNEAMSAEVRKNIADGEKLSAAVNIIVGALSSAAMVVGAKGVINALPKARAFLLTQVAKFKSGHAAPAPTTANPALGDMPGIEKSVTGQLQTKGGGTTGPNKYMSVPKKKSPI